MANYCSVLHISQALGVYVWTTSGCPQVAACSRTLGVCVCVCVDLLPPWSGSSRRAESGTDVSGPGPGSVSPSRCSPHHHPARSHPSSEPSRRTPRQYPSAPPASPGDTHTHTGANIRYTQAPIHMYTLRCINTHNTTHTTLCAHTHTHHCAHTNRTPHGLLMKRYLAEAALSQDLDEQEVL